MGCYGHKSNEGDRSWSDNNKDVIITTIKENEASKIPGFYDNGFRFHHRFRNGNVSMSYLNFAIQVHALEVLRNNKITVDVPTLNELVSGGRTVFAHILEDNTLHQSLVNSYGHEFFCEFDPTKEPDKNLIREFFFYEKGNQSTLWKNSRIIFGITPQLEKLFGKSSQPTEGNATEVHQNIGIEKQQ